MKDQIATLGEYSGTGYATILRSGARISCRGIFRSDQLHAADIVEERWEVLFSGTVYDQEAELHLVLPVMVNKARNTADRGAVINFIVSGNPFARAASMARHPHQANADEMAKRG